MNTEFTSTAETGCRLVTAITPFGHLGPKHHGLIIGRSTADGSLYVAESRHTGYGLTDYETFVARYRRNGPINLIPPLDAARARDSAKRALDEIARGDQATYNLLFNNCESFVNRHVVGHSTSYQVISGLIAITCLGLTVYLVGRHRGTGIVR